jgi:drug/metabolite transporter (DMT)-like permease
VGVGRLLGVMLAVAGAVLLWTGLTAQDSLTEKANKALTGHYTERTTQYLAGGGAALAGGVLLVLFGGGGGRRRR